MHTKVMQFIQKVELSYDLSCCRPLWFYFPERLLLLSVICLSVLSICFDFRRGRNFVRLLDQIFFAVAPQVDTSRPGNSFRVVLLSNFQLMIDKVGIIEKKLIHSLICAVSGPIGNSQWPINYQSHRSFAKLALKRGYSSMKHSSKRSPAEMMSLNLDVVMLDKVEPVGQFRCSKFSMTHE